MEQIEIFQILGIEPTKDERIIKSAYREKLSVTNPEDNPDGFKRLRTAFEEACRLARQTEPAGETEEKDLTPSGIWVAKVADIYANMISRLDVNAWKELFAEDIFLSLEEEENCRFKLIRFLMDHYKLPTEVWKLLDEKLNIVKDMAQLRERFPADFISFIASKCERGEDLVFEHFEGEPTAPYDLFLQYYEQCYRALDSGELEQAATLIENADGLHIFHPALEVCRADLYEKQGKIQEAVELLQNLRTRFPKDAMVCYNCAETLWRNERKADAAAVYESLKEENDSHYMANVRLAEWYYDEKRYQDAKKCAEKVLSSGGDDHFMELLKNINHELERNLEERFYIEKDWESGLELGWCYLQDGKINRGIRLAESIASQITEERDSEHKGLLTKLYMEETEYELAFDMADRWKLALEKRLSSDESEEDKEKDQDRIKQYHAIKMHIWRARGDKRSLEQEQRREFYQKALEEAEILETGTVKDIGLMLEEAQIYMEMEEYEKSLEITQRLITDYQIYAAYATEAEVYRRLWDASGVVRTTRQCINYFPTYIRAYEHMAKVFLDLKQPEDLKSVLTEAEQNGIKSVMLDAYRYQMEKETPDTDELNTRLKEFRKEYFAAVEDGKLDCYEKGLPILTEYLYWYPGTYMLVERALFHRVAHHYQEAIEDFEKALAENPTQQYALRGLSFVYKYQGDYEKALIYIKRTIRYCDDEMSHVIYADMADLYSLLGDYQGALAAYEEYGKRDGYKDRYHMNKLAMCMARCGEVGKAVELLKKAHNEYPFAYYDEAVNICQVASQKEKAQELLNEWNKKMLNVQKTLSNQDYANYYCRAAWQELMFGSSKQAFVYFDKELDCKKNGDPKGTLCDATFAAILCGEDERAKGYAAKLRELRKKAAEEGRNYYFDQEKGGLHMNFLADYYRLSMEELDQMLEQEAKCEICHFCTYAICKEMEAVRILHMLRKGETEAALERLTQNLEKQPLDEYMIAIRHMCEDGVRVTSYEQELQKKSEGKAAAGFGANAKAREKKAQEGLLTKLTKAFGKKK